MMSPSTRRTRSSQSSDAMAMTVSDAENLEPKNGAEVDVAETEPFGNTTRSKGKRSSAKKPKGSPKSNEKKSSSLKMDGVASRKRKTNSCDNEESLGSQDGSNEEKPKKKKSPTKKKASNHQRITEIDEIPKIWSAEEALKKGSYTFRIASWNVAGIRTLLKKEPNVLADLCKKHDLDMLCLQETKLQESNLDDPKLNIRGLLDDIGYDDYWSCSTVKKGYSGTAVFLKRHGKKKGKQADIGRFFAPKSQSKGSSATTKEPATLKVSPEILSPSQIFYGMGNEIDNEGRTIFLEYPFATIVNVYVPNSGQDLKRLEYRTSQWDKNFLSFMQKKEKERALPVIWLGDLNIAHKAYDVWNDGAKHLDKQAGVTPQERASFQEQLDSGYIDAFRKLHPSAKGHYSYWSQRAGNREPNKGLRLDYFICSPTLFSEDAKVVVRDSYMIKNHLGSDHCPVVLELEIKAE